MRIPVNRVLPLTLNRTAESSVGTNPPVRSPSAWECRRRSKMRGVWEGYIEHYNNVRLKNAIGYITPKDMLAAYQQEI
jgi:hypothetical protein